MLLLQFFLLLLTTFIDPEFKRNEIIDFHFIANEHQSLDLKVGGTFKFLNIRTRKILSESNKLEDVLNYIKHQNRLENQHFQQPRYQSQYQY